MVDFAKAFGEGMDAARRAAAARAEIKQVFVDLNDQLATVSNRTACLSVVTLREPVPKHGAGQALGLLVEIPSFLKTFEETRPYTALVIAHLNDESFKPREVARWRQDEQSGYPCWIVTRGREAECGDRTSLEQELAQLVQTPRVGDAVVAAMKHITPPPTATTPSAAEGPASAT